MEKSLDLYDYRAGFITNVWQELFVGLLHYTNSALWRRELLPAARFQI